MEGTRRIRRKTYANGAAIGNSLTGFGDGAADIVDQGGDMDLVV